jgi:quinol monooxygenase YgiN
VHVLAEVRIGDLEQFLDVFADEGLGVRKGHGCRGTQVFAPADDGGRVLVLLDFPDHAAFEAFRTDPDAPPVMRRGGAQGPPTFTVLERVGVFPH